MKRLRERERLVKERTRKRVRGHSARYDCARGRERYNGRREKEDKKTRAYPTPSVSGSATQLRSDDVTPLVA